MRTTLCAISLMLTVGCSIAPVVTDDDWECDCSNWEGPDLAYPRDKDWVPIFVLGDDGILHLRYIKEGVISVR